MVFGKRAKSILDAIAIDKVKPTDDNAGKLAQLADELAEQLA